MELLKSIRFLITLFCGMLIFSGFMNSEESEAFNIKNIPSHLPNIAQAAVEFQDENNASLKRTNTLTKDQILALASSNTKTPETKAKEPSNTIASDWGALAFFGELAPRNFRGSATYGKYFAPQHRAKLTGEYLTQKLHFNFHEGNRKKWVSQFAIGGEYQYLIHHHVFQSFELGTAYVHAFSHSVGTKTISDREKLKRRIAGSNGSLSFAGTTMRLWNCAFLALSLDYDWVHFLRAHQANKLSNGFGGSVGFVQRFAKDFSLNLDAEFRHPFTSYLGRLNWNHEFSVCSLDIGLFGNLTHGHDGVRTIRTIGLQLGLSFGPKATSCGWSPEVSSSGKNCYMRQYCDVSQWVATPAVYVPVVLAIADQKKISTFSCTGKAPTSTNPGNQIASFFVQQLPPTYISSSLPVTYTLSLSSPPLPGNTLTFDSTTGVITYVGEAADQTIAVTITATNQCGSTSQTFNIRYFLD